LHRAWCGSVRAAGLRIRNPILMSMHACMRSQDGVQNESFVALWMSRRHLRRMRNMQHACDGVRGANQFIRDNFRQF
jgi:hypothetical protein